MSQIQPPDDGENYGYAEVVEALRRYQESMPVLGPFFRDAYKFLWWVSDRQFVTWLPPVALRIGKLRGQRMAEYSPADGSLLPTITLDVTKSTDAYVAAEWLAHEMVHHYQFCTIGTSTVEGQHHDEEFLNIMMGMGLSVEPGTGAHRGYVGDLWDELIESFEIETAVRLRSHKLPGPQKPDRKLHKWQCPAGDCGFSFRSRRKDLKVMCVGMGDDTHSPAFMGMIE